MKLPDIYSTLFTLCAVFSACTPEPSSPLFVAVEGEVSGIDFTNAIIETESVNYFSYPYLYMGGGVAVGDINNDGLEDLYFTSNQGDNKLYLNRGGLRFEDITEAGGVAGAGRWSTGAVFADVNGDHLLDIYVSVSGKWATTANQLFINNGDLTFTESAEAYGLADLGNSTQATFLDYDRDGDLDVYVVNYPPLNFKSPNFVYRQNHLAAKPATSDHLYRNDRGRFTDVTEAAGILNFGLGLSATSADLNQDGWPDIYVSNDFAAPDFCYLNNGDGTFKESIREVTNHTAYYGMGTDIADFNNDGLPDILQVDMTPADNFRSKANMASMNPENFQDMIDLGLHHQYMENALQLNLGLDNGQPKFGDISRMTGMALTDWSWSPLFADFDNDGLKDVHVTNGTRRDINNKDYFNALKATEKNDTRSDLEKSLAIPSRRIANYAFRNEGDLAFTDVSKDWGLDFSGFSNGSAYADLDNDGDLDLVTNNIDDPASLFENTGSVNSWLTIKLKGPDFNHQGMDTKIEILANDKKQFAESKTTRGFQSASTARIHFGLGKASAVSSLKVTWFDGHVQVLENVAVNQELVLDYAAARKEEVQSKNPVSPIFARADGQLDSGYQHVENNYNDFATELLLPHATSKDGPALASGDVNHDGYPDLFVGNAKGADGKLMIQTPNGDFILDDQPDLALDAAQEDVAALFFDADGDGWDDLYVVSGGNEMPAGDAYYQDRLYLNKGGRLIKADDGLPLLNDSGSRVVAHDYDGDGDLDLVIGGRRTPGKYGAPASSRLLRNESVKGVPRFSDVTATIAPGLLNLGMVTDLAWTDFDHDGDDDLVLVGEWMPVTFFANEDGKLVDRSDQIPSTKDSRGWWFSITAADLNRDGFEDLILGNLGTNYKYRASPEATFDLYAGDFDQNGQRDLILGYYANGVQFPVRGRQCSSEQIPDIKKKFGSYNDFAAADLVEVYSAPALDNAELHYRAETFASQVWMNQGDNTYERIVLPSAAQMSAVNDVIVDDFDADGNPDLLIVGNLFTSEVETKRNDASPGHLLRGNGNGEFMALTARQSGFLANTDVKKITKISTSSGTLIVTASNNGPLRAWTYQLDNLIK